MRGQFSSSPEISIGKLSVLGRDPFFFGAYSNSRILEVYDSPNSASSVEQMQEEQMSMGYTDLKILVSTIMDYWSSEVCWIWPAKFTHFTCFFFLLIPFNFCTTTGTGCVASFCIKI